MGELDKSVLDGRSPEERQRIIDAAGSLLAKDAALDDEVFTPPPAIGFFGEGPELSDAPAVPEDKPPQNSGAAAAEIPIDA